MKARDIKGRKVVAVRQSPIRSTGNEIVYCIDEIEFTGGVVLGFIVIETDDLDYGVEGITVRRSVKTAL